MKTNDQTCLSNLLGKTINNTQLATRCRRRGRLDGTIRECRSQRSLAHAVHARTSRPMQSIASIT